MNRSFILEDKIGRDRTVAELSVRNMGTYSIYKLEIEVENEAGPFSDELYNVLPTAREFDHLASNLFENCDFSKI